MQGNDKTTDSKSAFWKNFRNIHGRPSDPNKGPSKTRHKRNPSSSSFQNFQKNTDDAWDIGDDDFCVMPHVVHPQVNQSVATNVISKHSGRSRIVTAVHIRSASAGEADVTRKADDSDLSDIRAAALQKVSSCRGHQQLSSWQRQGPGRGIRHCMIPSTSHPRSHIKYLQSRTSQREVQRLQKFRSLLSGPNTDLEELKELSWSGIPPAVRPITWRLLAGYLPANCDRRESTLERKREEYFNYVKQYYNTRLQDIHQETHRQIHIDIPRMSPLVPLFQQQIVQEMFERILYIWAIRHPASGYVQGMNDLLTPFFVVFLQEVVPSGSVAETYEVSLLSKECLEVIEADSYWCLSKLLDGIQENYTFAQPGIQRKINTLKDLMKRIDVGIRGFSTFHLYVCAAFLKHWSKDLLTEKDFQGIMLTIQNLPTMYWGDEEINMLVAEAYQLKFTFADAPNHLQPEKK
ncbi:TBC1 domain family member 22B-like isoform X2 [Tachypleus tridentatus]|uniref:TBC1 domain family member 22B-like isoform X2 n=1 Tax=Tachypleus tridentatus TaxID=6853 RepID=UPI003FD09197